MKKYKLIKIYPGSPKLGTIRKVPDSFRADNNELWYHITKYPEFWEKVVEKNYLITGYYKKPNNIHINPAGNFSKGFKEEYDIYQIKRLSDAEIFTIGDKIKDGNIITKIDRFFIKNDNLLFTTEDTNCGNYLINLIKYKQPLFKTEDGVDIFTNQKYYSVRLKDLTISGPEMNNTATCSKLFKTFSTKEKAEEYILLNKPCLSYGDIQEFIKVKDCNKVLKLVQQKLNNNK